MEELTGDGSFGLSNSVISLWADFKSRQLIEDRNFQYFATFEILPPNEITVCACVRAKLFQACLTLCNAMDYIPPGSSVHGILQARILEWGLPGPSQMKPLGLSNKM